MATELDEECGHSLSTKDGRCERNAKYPDGKCGYHTDYRDSEDGDYAPNYEHGLYMDRSGYYENLPEKEQDWIDAVVESFLRDAPFDRDHIGKLTKLREVAIDMHKKRRADEYISNKGMAQEKEVGYHEEYGVLTETQENVLHITADRLSRSSLRTLKELGITDDDRDKKKEIGDSLINELSKEVDDDED